MTEDEGWPRGTTGDLTPGWAAVVTGTALVFILLVVAALCVAVLLVVRGVA
ncbi:hypothetical protein [Actinoplanes sp. NPDC051851]|uniref:hypothetical protein n=1 Tax=Actinoplanes sp. NPDC051851 TaxID=3154753 RepID=UPI0034379739